MKKEFDYQSAMTMLNTTLREMKSELKEVDSLSLSKNKQDKATHMHEIYNEIYDLIDEYARIQTDEEFNYACRQIEILKPEFILNYSDILTDH